MAEVDYQLALLLQHQFEQENKDCEVAKALQQSYKNEHQNQMKQKSDQTNLNDSILAKSLQEQFRTEVEVETHGNNLAYSSSSSLARNNSKSLTDPSWEVIDPTPDIHNLFMVFNDKFFWNQLGSVCVYWSKRMTTCAGLCSYQGRGGMCTISLSEPLLKLRPRKDLVETLLHEMIHAYLFVTNNNRDRDGHGPEFHKHMHRINNEAGTKISVYHDFHDEVRLYLQHWWKCTGPCQKWKPYFGMVRRAMNRAPGPADRWWGEHSQKCGGQFIKVKEPEKATKLPVQKPKNQPDIKKFLTPPEMSKKSSSDNVKTISTNNPNSSVNKVIPNSSNIFGFSNLGGDNNNKNNNKGGTLVKNNSNTIVINKKPGTSSNAKPKVSQSVPDKSRAKSVPEKTISTPIGGDTNYSVVRNHWINKFSNSNENTTENKPSTSKDTNPKRKSLDLCSSSSPKIPKVSALLVECPNCSQNIPEHQINPHLDTCLNSSEAKNCDSVLSISAVDFEEQQVNEGDSFRDDVFEISGDNISSDNLKKCEVCQKMISIGEYGVHINQCLHGMFDRIEEEYNFDESEDVNNESSAETKCLACGKTILKSLLNDHLEDCMNLSNIFEDKNEPTEGSAETVENSEIARKIDTYNCPSCMDLFSESEMNDHIDICLDISNASNST